MIILASASPRRKELLAQLGLAFECVSADIDESILTNELPQAYVERLAQEKAHAIFQQYPNATVIGSDTSVVIAGEILGKPRDKAHAVEMLTQLSGQQHQVYTGVAVASQEKKVSTVVVTNVEFKSLSPVEIDNYWHTNEPQDKAGAYAIQGLAGQFIKAISGSYSSVVGLPLYETSELLTQCNIALPMSSGGLGER